MARMETMVENIFQSKWFSGQVEKEAARDVLRVGDRVGELLALIGSVIFIAFIAIHQTRPTGFFTGDSGDLAASLVYLVLAVGMVPPAVRLVAGRRNVARPLEAAGMAVFVVVGLYLLIVFPFDMSRFAQPLPRSLEFLLDWIPELLARSVLAIGSAACIFFSPYTFQLYLSVKGRLSGQGVPEPMGD